MSDEEKKELEVKDEESESKEEDKKEEKKENAFSRFWNKTKKSINDSILEGKIEGAYEKDLPTYKVFEKDALLSNNIKGKLDGDKLVVFGEVKFKLFSVVLDDKENAFYLTNLEPTNVKSTVEGVEYERVGTILTLDKNVEEVKVVKAGKRYFLYKGTEE